MSNPSEITLLVTGKYKHEVKDLFWAWWLDGGGAQMFAQSLEDTDAGFDAIDTYDEELEQWVIDTMDVYDK